MQAYQGYAGDYSERLVFWCEWATADNSSALVGALRLLKGMCVAFLGMLQGLGLVPMEPIRIRQRIVMVQGKFCVVCLGGEVFTSES